MIVGLLFLSMLTSTNSCHPLRGPNILGEDLRQALPAFSGMPGDAVVAISPAAGVQRRFTSVDLARIGRKYGIAVPADTNVCFEWPMVTLTASSIAASMGAALKPVEARVEVLAMSHTTAPAGQIEFPLTGLSASTLTDPLTPVTWRGQVRYGGSREFEIWARVRLAVTTTRVVATENLLPGRIIANSQVRLETYDEFPLKHEVVRNLDEVVGKLIRRPIRSGQPVFRMDLTDPLLVSRGQAVDVTVVSGAAEIRLEAVANTSGRQGETVSLTNPQTGKLFQARVTAKGKAILVANGPSFVARIQ